MGTVAATESQKSDVARVTTFKNLTFSQRRELVELYNKKWCNLKLLEKAAEKTYTPPSHLRWEEEKFKEIHVDLNYFEERSELFPEGQLVAIDGRGNVGGALTTIPARVSSLDEIPTSYERLHRRYVSESFSNTNKQHSIIFCVSIISACSGAVDALFSAIMERGQGSLIMPYSAPRSLRMFYRSRPERKVVLRHLSMSFPNSGAPNVDVPFYFSKKYGEFYGLPPELNYLRSEPLQIGLPFLFQDWFQGTYGVSPTFTDFLLLTNRKPNDSIMAFHLLRGADYVLKNKDLMLFENSRPEDVMAHGYNILLTYTKLPSSLI